VREQGLATIRFLFYPVTACLREVYVRGFVLGGKKKEKRNKNERKKMERKKKKERKRKERKKMKEKRRKKKERGKRKEK
jgi:hypothetical protein